MIRINLLESERAARGKGAAGAAGGGPSVGPYVPLVASLVLSVGGIGYVWWSITNEIATTEANIETAKATVATLEKERARKEELERKRKSVQDQVALIERLKMEQAGPVRMLDEISKALPDFVWLTSLTQSGAQVKLAGESSNNNAIADYLSNLQRAGDNCDPAVPANRVNCWFPDANIDGYVEQGGGTILQFNFTATFQNPEVAQKAAAVAAAPARK
jgi:type IV pilus assembly protein PilN